MFLKMLLSKKRFFFIIVHLLMFFFQEPFLFLTLCSFSFKCTSLSIQLQNSIFCTYFSWPLLLPSRGDTCFTCWNRCCLYKDQNNWKPGKCLTETLPSKELPETEKSHCRWGIDAWVRLTWFITPCASTRVT